MKKTTGDILVECLLDWEVEVIFGFPGDGINGIMESLRKRQTDIQFIQVRHEESAAFMACAYAKYTGKLGVCIATSGPGGIHLLNGLYDAKLDGQPVLAITGMQFHDLLHTFQQQDVELDKLFENVAVYNSRVMGPAHMENVMNLACRTALARRGVAHVTVPVDFQEQPCEKRSARNVSQHNTHVRAHCSTIPQESDLRQAADLLNKGKKIVILAGAGALHATDELEKIAEILGAVIIKPLLGKAAVPDDSPYTTGGIGLLGTSPSADAIESCDTLLIIGSSFPYIEFYPKPGQASIVQIELDAARIGLRCPVDIGLKGDSKETLHYLLPFLKKNESRFFLKKAQENMKEWNDLMKMRQTCTEMPMKPQVVAAELGKRLKSNAIISSDSGTITTWVARDIPAQRGQMFSLSGNLATMAPGLPYAIAAQVAYPHRQCIAFVGDGGFSMLMADFATAVKYKLPIKVFVIKNNTLGQIKWEQIVFLGNPEYEVELQPINFCMIAEACGGTAFRIENPHECGNIIEQALNTPGPVLVEAVVDPYEPPMPPKVTLADAKNFAKALIRGEPNRGEIIKTIMKDKIREII
jgi:pyruvate dehydrogenase (quinone)/pyruvate oxidase